jgi:spore germination cell wall hydrolase CwlJ-like protein
MTLKQGISLTIRNVVVALTTGVLFASTNALAAQGPNGLVAMNVETKYVAQNQPYYVLKNPNSNPLSELNTTVQPQEKSDNDTTNQRQLLCLATNIYHEAGGESKTGKAAVAHVTLNRVNSPRFPRSICGVVHQRSGRSCQFSWTCDRRPDAIPNKERNSAWKESMKVALLVLRGELSDPTRGAMFFHERRVRPGWGNRIVRTTQIGNHIFYRHI